MHNIRKIQNAHTRKLQKMKEWKTHFTENDQKCTPRKMTEKSQLENDRKENTHQENGRKITPGK